MDQLQSSSLQLWSLGADLYIALVGCRDIHGSRKRTFDFKFRTESSFDSVSSRSDMPSVKRITSWRVVGATGAAGSTARCLPLALSLKGCGMPSNLVLSVGEEIVESSEKSGRDETSGLGVGINSSIEARARAAFPTAPGPNLPKWVHME